MSSSECQVNPSEASSPQTSGGLERGFAGSFQSSSPTSLDKGLKEEEDTGSLSQLQAVDCPRNELVGFRPSTESMSFSESRTTPEIRTKDLSINIRSHDRSDELSMNSPKHHGFLEPTPGILRTSATPFQTPFNAGSSSFEISATERHGKTGNDSQKSLQALSDADPSVRRPEAPPSDIDEGSKSEIQSIMDQFETDPNDQSDGATSTTLELSTKPLTGSTTQHPPRKSSLEPMKSTQLQTDSPSRYSAPQTSSDADGPSEFQEKQGYQASPSVPSKRTSSIPNISRFGDSAPNTPSSTSSPLSLRKPLPPEPDPEPDLPFDFHRFLEQLRHRTADPVAKFLRSFLVEFGKKQWLVHEQVKLISDFLAFITNKMSQCEVWRGVSDAEFDNAKEGMEKLVMNRLYSQTFSPVIPLPAPAPGTKGKRKNLEKLLGPGRRGQHQEDIERDEILGQKVRIYGWVQEEHLDIMPVGESGRRFLALAQQELLKIKNYRAPRDKIICVLNCCKVIFGLLRNSKAADTSADSFVPLLIYVVLHANPEHLVSNVQYILRFRNQDKLGGEAGYYLSSLMGAIQFIENLDRTTLTVSDADFERNVEAAVFAIAERHREETPLLISHPVSEKSRLSEPEVAPRNSVEAEYVNPVRPTASRSSILTGEGSDESTAVNGLLRTIQKPLSSIGRIFSEESSKIKYSGDKSLPEPVSRPPPPPPPPPPPILPPRLSPAVFQPPRRSNDKTRSFEASRGRNPLQNQGNATAEDAAARQASAEAAEAQRLERIEHDDVVETLAGIFPDLDRDVINDVVRMKQGRVGSAVDACLALNS